MKKQKSVMFGCFSPPVMVATFLIEISLAIYVLLRYKADQKRRLIIALLVCLGLFQLAEYFVCTNSTITVNASRFGYAAITMLPPLGFLLMGELTKMQLSKKLLFALSALTLSIASYFLLAPNAFRGYECTGNYVIFQLGPMPGYAYGVFYFSLLAAAVLKGLLFLRTAINKKQIVSVWSLLLGYAVFIVPVAVLVVLNPDTSKAVPSIMCGFAVGLAIILAGLLAPRTLKQR